MRIVLHLSFAQLHLFFQRQRSDVLALRCAAAIHFFSAGFTLDKKQMTIVVGAVYVAVAGLTALVTGAYDIVGYFFSHALVEHKIFSDEF